MEAGLTDTGYTPSSLKFAFQNANAQNGTSLGQNLGNYGRNAGNNLMNGSTYNKLLANAKGPQGQQLAMKTGMKMLTPQQRPQMAMAPPPQQGQQQPLTNPYQNSLSMGLTEEQKQKLRAMGYPV